jgi:type IV secretory pathway VirB2 component (pilin)
MPARGATNVSAQRRSYVYIHSSIRSALIAAVAAAALASTPAAAAESPGSEYGFGAACALSNLVYGPAKLLFATGGAIVSGFAWIFSGGDDEVAPPIWNASLRGDYVVVPDNLRGKKRLEFIGRSPEQARAMEGSRKQAPEEEGF